MYLRRLEILGFKSFAQKTTLDFPRGVPAVVGPNGCGKSNVLDAIRWAWASSPPRPCAAARWPTSSSTARIRVRPSAWPR